MELCPHPIIDIRHLYDMKIKELKLENFRCFKEAKFEFADQTTVLIGKNGTGKSSLIKGLIKALDFIFEKNTKDWGFPSLANGLLDMGSVNIDLQNIHHNGEIADFVNLKGLAFLNRAKEIDSSANQEIPFSISWEIKRNAYDYARIQKSLYKEAYIRFRENLNETDNYPLLVYYSDRYPHINTRISERVRQMLKKYDTLPRNWGYFHWDDFSSCTEIWQKRFIKVYNETLTLQRNINESTTNSNAGQIWSEQMNGYMQEIAFVTEFLKRFSSNEIKGLSDKEGNFKITSVGIGGVDDYYLKLYFADGIQRRWDELPAGLERLFSIVFDIAYRSYVLNRGHHEPQGIVLIDEVDLHLHPSLQQDVLLRLQFTFPKIQFIITTHSPLVITNLRQDDDNRVIQMEREGETYSHDYTGNLYIHDYLYTLYEVMHTEPRAFALKVLDDRYIRFRHRGKDNNAEEVLAELRRLIGERDFETYRANLDAKVAEG